MATRRETVLELTSEEYDSYELISTKLSCARTSLGQVPDQLDEDGKKIFIKSVLDSLSDYMWLEKDWWNKIFDKLGLERFSCELYFDGARKEIYKYVE